MTRRLPLDAAAAFAALLFSAASVFVIGAPGTARAACDPNPPSDDDAVVCTGTDETGFDGTGATNLTITTSGVVSMDDSSALDAAIAVSDGNDVTIGVGATVTVTETNGAGVRGGDENFVRNDGRIVVDGANGVAIDVGSVIPITDDRGTPDPADDLVDIDPTPTPTITNGGTIVLRGAGAVGLRTVDNYDVETEAGSAITIEATATGGVAILGSENNIVEHGGTITIEATNAAGVRLGENTGLPLPNGAIFQSTSRTIVRGDDSVAMEVGDNTGTLASGTIDLIGANTVGVRAGNRDDISIPANHTNQGTINVLGDDAVGMQMGDGWIEYDQDDVPNGNGIRNQGTIDVSGARGVAIFAGDAGNATGDHDSFVNSSGTISVTGTDAIGISVGGNDLLDRLDFDDTSANLDVVTVFVSGGSISGGPDAGPLVEFRNFVAGRENRITNFGSIRADLTNVGTTNRGVAIRGTAGDELFVNSGTLRGDVEFLGGDDRYVVDEDSVYEGGTIDGGTGNDEVRLRFTAGGVVPTFDTTGLVGFERVAVDGRDGATGDAVGWRIDDAGFDVPVFVVAGGRLSAPANPDDTTAPVRFDAPLTIDPAGSVFVAPDGTTTPIVITDTATLDGELTVTPTPLLNTAGTYRLIEATGGIGTSRFATENVPASTGLLLLSTDYDATGVDLIVQTTGTFAGVALGDNRFAIASYIDALEADGTSTPEINDWIAELRASTADLNGAYDGLDPTPYDAQTSMIAESSRRLAHLFLDRPRGCVEGALDRWSATIDPVPCHRGELGAWATAIGSLRERKEINGRPEYDADIGGVVLGVDLPSISDLDLTVGLAVQRGLIDVSGYGESELVLGNLSGHASWHRGPLRVQGHATYGFGSHDDEREILIDETTTVIDRTGDEDHTSHHLGVSAEAGYLFDVGPIDLEPLVGLDYVWITQEEIAEGGVGGFGLIVDERDDSVLYGTAGLRISTVYHHKAYVLDQLLWMDGVWRPSIDLRWRQQLVGAEREIEARLVGGPDTVGGFTVEGEEDTAGVEVGAGVSFVPEQANRLQIDLRYDLFRGPDTLDHELVARLRIGF